LKAQAKARVQAAKVAAQDAKDFKTGLKYKAKLDLEHEKELKERAKNNPGKKVEELRRYHEDGDVTLLHASGDQKTEQKRRQDTKMKAAEAKAMGQEATWSDAKYFPNLLL
jgi:hypothetical protein